MSNKKGQELISKFKTLTDFIEEIAKTGDENAALILEELNSFGRLLVDYVLECSNEISKLNAQNVESEEDIKKLKEKLEALEKAVPKKDYQYYYLLAQNKYKKYWSIMEENSKTFITTAMYVFNLLKVHGVDFSPVILEYAKSVEVEMTNKIYFDFIVSSSKKPILPQKKGVLKEAIVRYKDTQHFFLPFATMFHSLKVPKYMDNSYIRLLQQTLKKDGWNMSILTSSDFILEGSDFAENFRNAAAHEITFTLEDSVVCSQKSKKLLSLFLDAYPKSK